MLLSNLNLLATAPGGVARLRELILTLAVQGKLVPQDPSDEPASELLKKIRAEKDRLIAEGKIKRDKPLAEIAEDEKPYALPCGWQWVRLQQAYDVRDGTHDTPKYQATGYPLVTSKNIYGGVLDLSDVKLISPADHEQISARSKVDRNDILFAMIGSIGNPVLVDTDVEFSVKNVALFKYYAASLSCPQYLLLVLQTEVAGMKDRAAGGVQAFVSLGQLRSRVVALPPLAEQSRIVTRVEELMRLCDALEAKGQLEATQHAQLVNTLLATLSESETSEQLTDNWHRIATHFDLLLDRPQAVDALEQTILQLAVRGLLVPQDPQDEPASALLKKIRAEKDKLIAEGKIKRDKPLPPIAEDEQPFALQTGWEWVRFGILPFSAHTGLDRGRNLQSDTLAFPYFKMNNISNSGGTNFANMTRVDATSEELAKYQLQVDDFLFNTRNSRELVGKTCVIDRLPEENTIFNNNILVSRFHRQVDARFIDIWFRSPQGQTGLDQIKSATTNVCAIYQGNLFEFPCPIPPLAEQSRIVTRVAQLRGLCADLRQRLNASQSTQAHLAEALVQSIG